MSKYLVIYGSHFVHDCIVLCVSDFSLWSCRPLSTSPLALIHFLPCFTSVGHVKSLSIDVTVVGAMVLTGDRTTLGHTRLHQTMFLLFFY